MKVVGLHEVWPELLAAAEWYELEQVGLAAQFLEEVDEVLAEIQEFPERFSMVAKDARRARCKRFPFGVFYVIRSECVYIFAIAHLNRSPRRWAKRIPKQRKSK